MKVSYFGIRPDAEMNNSKKLTFVQWAGEGQYTLTWLVRSIQ